MSIHRWNGRVWRCALGAAAVWGVMATSGEVFGPSPAAAADSLDRIVAVLSNRQVSKEPVEEGIVTQTEVDAQAEPLLRKLRASGQEVDPSRVRQQVINRLIMNKLLQMEGNGAGVTISDADIDGAMAVVEKNNNMAPGTLPKALAKEGIKLDDYRRKLAEELLRNRIIQARIAPLVTVSDEEVEDLLKRESTVGEASEVRVGQILLALGSNTAPREAARIQKLAEELHGKLKRGGAMQALAAQYSDDHRGLEGGDLGWLRRGQLLPEVEEMIFSLPKGGVSDVFQSRQGFHIFQVFDRRGAGGDAAQQTMTEFKVRHIVLKVDKREGEDSAERQRLKAEEILREHRTGSPFDELAKRFSQDESARDGGDLGWFGEGVMVTEFEKALLEMTPGQVAGPVRTRFGWHLIWLEEKRTLEPNSVRAKRETIRQRLMEARIQERFEQFLRDLRMRSFVEMR
ncbi:MAG: peptidylprolyl isomerase [Magnetococcales bacterium]|nr:peptidylprolyl isomerase [Magnetococcales bacterium]